MISESAVTARSVDKGAGLKNPLPCLLEQTLDGQWCLALVLGNPPDIAAVVARPDIIVRSAGPICQEPASVLLYRREGRPPLTAVSEPSAEGRVLRGALLPALLGLATDAGGDLAKPAGRLLSESLGDVTVLSCPSYRLGDGLAYVELATPPTALYRQDAVGIWQSLPERATPLGVEGAHFILLEEGVTLVLGADGSIGRLAPEVGLALDAFLTRLRDLPERSLMRVREAVLRQLATRGAAAGLADLICLRTMLPARAYPAGADGIALALDLAVPVPGDGLFLTGRWADPHRLTQQLALVSPTGEALLLPPLMHRFRTAEGTDGFCAFVPWQRGMPGHGQVRAQALLPGGIVADAVAAPFTGGWVAARDAILKAVPAEQVDEGLIASVLAPALAPIQRACVEGRRVTERQQWGTPVAAPARSLIIPLYREYGFIRHQLHALAFDPDMAATELIYVLDLPEDAERVRVLLNSLYSIYRLPVTLLVAASNYGYAVATNLGAAAARAPVLVLMNSDVVPARHGWLGRWQAAHEADPRTGISGPCLLYADGSLQHAGLFFEAGRVAWWNNNHYHKGLPGDWPPAQIARYVPAVTGACAMVARDLYERVGGLCEEYVIGDYEDSDLCLAIRRQGLEAYYHAGERLYHVERHSIRHNGAYTSSAADRYNGWLHSQRWGADIAALMQRFQPGSAG